MAFVQPLEFPRDPPGLEFTITALFSLLVKNTVSEKMVSGYHVIVRVFVSTVSIYRVFVSFSYYTVFTSHNDLSFSYLTSALGFPMVLNSRPQVNAYGRTTGIRHY